MIPTLVGWIGFALVLGAYGLLQFGFVESDAVVYQVMNLIGGATLAVNTFTQRAWPAMSLNIIWAVIALWALLQLA